MTKNDEQKYIKWGAIGIGAIVAWKLISPLTAAAGSVSQVLATKAENSAIQKTTGLSESEVQLCRDVATKTKEAMYVTGFWQMSWFGGSTEDEDTVVQQLNRLITAAQAQTASDFYKTFSGKGLASDVAAYLDQDDRMKIKSIILSNLT